MKKFLSLSLLALLLPRWAVAADAPPASASSNDKWRPAWRELIAREPSCEFLQAAAVRIAGLDPARSASWLRRVRKAALLPALQIHAEESDLSVTHIDATTEPYEYAGYRVYAQLTWTLDRLLFDRNELRVAREVDRQSARRDQIMSEVARLYYARRRLQLEALQNGPNDPAFAQDKRMLEVEELTAILEGLTGGAMREHMQDRSSRERMR